MSITGQGHQQVTMFQKADDDITIVLLQVEEVETLQKHQTLSINH